MVAKNLEQILARSGINPGEFLKSRLPNPNRNKYLRMQALKKVNLYMHFVYFLKIQNQ